MDERIAESVRGFKAEVSLKEVSRRMTTFTISPRVTALDLREYLMQLILNPRSPAADIWREVTGGSKGEIPRSILNIFKDIILEQGRSRAKAACAVLYEDWALPWQPPENAMRYIHARLEDQMSIREVRQRYGWTLGMYSAVSHESKVLLPALADLSPRMMR
jgi:hypothetical protein